MEKVVGKILKQEDIVADICDICDEQVAQKYSTTPDSMDITYYKYDPDTGEIYYVNYDICPKCVPKVLDLFIKR